MARKPGSKSEFVLFDVVYTDGAQRSNRKVPKESVEGDDGDEQARRILEDQDREISKRSGQSMNVIKSI